MPTITKWLVEKRVILSQAHGDMLREDILEFADEIERLGKDGSPPIHLIQDRRFLGEPYTSFTVAGRLVRVTQNLGGWFLVIDQGKTNSGLSFITTIITQAVGLKTHAPFPDFPSLWDFLVTKDPSLPADVEPPADNLLVEEV